MIQKACLEYLNLLPRCYAFRSSSGAIKTQSGRWFKTGRPGLPDISATIEGIPFYFEVKTKTGKQSPSQKKAEKDITEAGGYYCIVRSVRDVRDAIKRVSEKRTKQNIC